MSSLDDLFKAHQSEQSSEAAKEVAFLIADYFKSLMENGVPYELACELTLQFQDHMIVLSLSKKDPKNE